MGEIQTMKEITTYKNCTERFIMVNNGNLLDTIII